MNKLVTIGECLIDFTPSKQDGALIDVANFTKNAGGAPANVAAVAAKFGQHAALLTQVGQDAFGAFLIKTLTLAVVETKYIAQTTEGETSLAFVSLTADGNRDFLFYRRHAADLLYGKEQLPKDFLTTGDSIHFCSVNLVESPMKYAHEALIEQAHDADCLVSFDPNVRLPLWHDTEACRKTILHFLPKAHIVELSDEELLFLTHIEEEQRTVQSLFHGKVQVLFVTHGENGATLYTKKQHVQVNATSVKAVDTTGAGDAFIGAVLTMLLEQKITPATLEPFCTSKAQFLLSFANQYAGASTQKHGAIASYLTKDELSFSM